MLSAALPEHAAAGARMVAEIEELGAGSTVPRRAEIWVDGNRVRIDDIWAAAGVTWNTMLYHADGDVFVGLDRAERSYVRIDRATLSAIGAKVRMLRMALDAQLGMLSSEQRATAARMLGSSEIRRGSAPPLLTHDTGEREVVDWRDCRVVEVQRDGRSVGRVWVASWDQLAVSEDSLQVFGKLAALLGELNGTVDVGGLPPEIFEVFSGFGGFPMRVRWTHDGRPKSEVRFISVLQEETGSQLFEIPGDYRQRGLAGRAPASVAPTRYSQGRRDLSG
jgi:hypothetical protein